MMKEQVTKLNNKIQKLTNEQNKILLAKTTKQQQEIKHKTVPWVSLGGIKVLSFEPAGAIKPYIS